jgi:bifunctional DNase/RNase
VANSATGQDIDGYRYHEGPLGAQFVDARPSDALNLAAITDARVFVSSDLVDDFERLPDHDSAEARSLRLAVTVPQMRIARATESDLMPDLAI